jgi:transcriptional regulator with XRE-family HTH domain
MGKISKNIKHLRTLKQWSQAQLAEALDIPRARIGSYEEARCDPPMDTLIRLSALFQIAIDALVKCDLSQFDAAAMMKVGENRILFPIVVDKENIDQVEVVTLKASAGYLQGYADPEYIEKLSVMSLPFRTTGKLRAFPIKGDSMPPFKNGSFVVGKFIENLSEVQDGKTYVVVTQEEGLVYKRVYKKGKQLELHSDNTAYAPYRIKQAEAIELWQFVCAIHTDDGSKEEPNMLQMMNLLKSMKSKLDAMG